MKKIAIITFALLIFLGTNANSVITTAPRSVSWLPLGTGEVALNYTGFTITPDIADPLYTAGTSNVVFTSARGIVTMAIDWQRPYYYGGNFKVNTSGVIDWERADGSPGVPVNFNLEIYYYSDGTQIVKSADNIVIPGAVSMHVDVDHTTAEDINTHASLAPENFFITASIEVERYQQLSAVAPSITSFTTDADGRGYNIHWNTVDGGEEYQLEWGFISTHDNISVLDYAFTNNSTRITTSTDNYLIPAVYGEGILVSRVRARGRNISDVNQVVYGSWSSNSYFTISSSNALERGKNWNYGISFDDLGNKQEGIQYYDGILKNRQTIARNFKDDKTIVQSTIYDRFGRPAISTLPVPDVSTGMPQSLSYKWKFNRPVVDNTREYRYEDLQDYDNECAREAAAMADGYGSEKYYSNYHSGDWTKYLPKSQTFPFAEVAFRKDPLGIPSASALAGETLRMGAGHETKYIYNLNPSSQVLKSLFGSNIGNIPKNYTKSKIIDPNGIQSLIYKSSAGQVIATAYGGTPSNTFVSTSGNENEFGVQSISDDLQVLAAPNVDYTDPSHSCIKVTTQYNPNQTAMYTFDYSITIPSYHNDCLLENICFECNYNLSLSIIDITCENEEMVPEDYRLRQIGTLDTTCNESSTRIFSFGLNGDNEQINTLSLPFEFEATHTYVVTKELCLDGVSTTFYAESYLANLQRTDPCWPSIGSFMGDLNDLDLTSCYTSCEDCLRDLGPYTNYNDETRKHDPSYIFLTQEQYDNIAAQCSTVCARPAAMVANVCDEFLEQMKLQMMPGAEYAPYVLNGDGEAVVDEEGKPIIDFDNPYSIFYNGSSDRYVIAYNDPALLYVGDNEGTTIDIDGDQVDIHDLTPEEFIENIQYYPEWMEELVKHHPEYCRYLFCKDNLEESFQYDLQMEQTNTYEDAYAAGLLNPLNNAPSNALRIPDNTGNTDPLFVSNPGYESDMEVLMNDIVDATGLGSGLDIWQISFTDLINDPSHSLYCAGDKGWIKFRDNYLSLKYQIIAILIDKLADCPTFLNGGDPFYGGRIEQVIDFGDDPAAIMAEIGINPSSATFSTDLENYEDNMILDAGNSSCHNKRNLWAIELAHCGLEESVINDLLDELEGICTAGISINSPEGASTCPVPNANGRSSFEQVIRDVLAAHNVLWTDICNPYMISDPEPGGNTFQHLFTEPDQCACDAILNASHTYDSLERYGLPKGICNKNDFFLAQLGIEFNEDLYQHCAGIAGRTIDCNTLQIWFEQFRTDWEVRASTLPHRPTEEDFYIAFAEYVNDLTSAEYSSLELEAMLKHCRETSTIQLPCEAFMTYVKEFETENRLIGPANFHSTDELDAFIIFLQSSRGKIMTRNEVLRMYRNCVGVSSHATTLISSLHYNQDAIKNTLTNAISQYDIDVQHPLSENFMISDGLSDGSVNSYKIAFNDQSTYYTVNSDSINLTLHYDTIALANASYTIILTINSSASTPLVRWFQYGDSVKGIIFPDTSRFFSLTIPPGASHLNFTKTFVADTLSDTIILSILPLSGALILDTFNVHARVVNNTYSYVNSIKVELWDTVENVRRANILFTNSGRSWPSAITDISSIEELIPDFSSVTYGALYHFRLLVKNSLGQEYFLYGNADMPVGRLQPGSVNWQASRNRLGYPRNYFYDNSGEAIADISSISVRHHSDWDFIHVLPDLSSPSLHDFFLIMQDFHEGEVYVNSSLINEFTDTLNFKFSSTYSIPQVREMLANARGYINPGKVVPVNENLIGVQSFLNEMAARNLIQVPIIDLRSDANLLQDIYTVNPRNNPFLYNVTLIRAEGDLQVIDSIIRIPFWNDTLSDTLALSIHMPKRHHDNEVSSVIISAQSNYFIDTLKASLINHSALIFVDSSAMLDTVYHYSYRSMTPLKFYSDLSSDTGYYDILISINNTVLDTLHFQTIRNHVLLRNGIQWLATDDQEIQNLQLSIAKDDDTPWSSARSFLNFSVDTSTYDSNFETFSFIGDMITVDDSVIQIRGTARDLLMSMVVPVPNSSPSLMVPASICCNTCLNCQEMQTLVNEFDRVLVNNHQTAIHNSELNYYSVLTMFINQTYDYDFTIEQVASFISKCDSSKVIETPATSAPIISFVNNIQNIPLSVSVPVAPTVPLIYSSAAVFSSTPLTDLTTMDPGMGTIVKNMLGYDAGECRSAAAYRVDDVLYDSIYISYYLLADNCGNHSTIISLFSTDSNQKNLTTVLGPVRLVTYTTPTGGRIGAWEAWASYDGTTPAHRIYIRPDNNLPIGEITYTYTEELCNPKLVKAYMPPCLTLLLNAANNTAYQQYTEYMQHLKDDFIHAYVDHCMGSLNEEMAVNYEESEYHYTLYYYNLAGELEQTVPPAGVNPAIPPAEPSHTMTSRYQFNSLGATTLQSTPDADDVYYYYDKYGRIVATQSGRLRAVHGGNVAYTYLLYDDRSRVIESGKLNIDQYSPLDDATAYEPSDFATWMAAGTKNEITRTYYDEPKWAVPDFEQHYLRSRIASVTFSEFDNEEHYDHATHYDYDIHGNVVRLVQEFPELAGFNSRYFYIDYDFNLLSGRVNKVYYQKDRPGQFIHKYTYDENNRLQMVETSTDGIIWYADARYEYYPHGPLMRTVLGDEEVQGMDYAYTINGWIKGMNAGSLNPEKDMGQDGNGLAGTNGYTARDAFGYTLGYFSYNSGGNLVTDYTPSDANVEFDPGLGSTGLDYRNAADAGALYNGNISRMVTAMMDNAENPLDVTGNQYRYDYLNRLATKQTYINTASNILSSNSFSGITAANDYKEGYMYDPNGNITSLLRNQGGGTVAMDQLTYSYVSGTNKLAHVDDAISSSNSAVDIDDQSSGNYDYDEDGNLIKDNAENIDNIEWNIAGKIKKVDKSSASMEDDLYFQYDATGKRIIKEANNLFVGSSKYYYIYDAGGNIMAVYTTYNTGIQWEMYLLEQPIYGSSRVGLCDKRSLTATNTDAPVRYASNESVTDVEFPEYGETLNNYTPPTPEVGNIDATYGWRKYELSNHLGNVHIVISDQKIPLPDGTGGNVLLAYKPDVISANDYYSFGMLINNRHFNTEVYRFGFNGKESEGNFNNIGNTQDFGARIYNNRLARFQSSDMLKGLTPDEGPYNFAGNMPVSHIDYDGYFKMDAKFVKRYPTLAKILQYQLPTLANNSAAIEAWTRATGFSADQFKDLVNWGSGPWVTPTRKESEFPGNLFVPGGSAKQPFNAIPGSFDDKYWPNNLFVGFADLDRLEATYKTYLTTKNDAELQFEVFLVSCIILHESAHYGFYWNRKLRGYSTNESGEVGADLERLLFGEPFSYTAYDELGVGIEINARRYFEKQSNNIFHIDMKVINPFWWGLYSTGVFLQNSVLKEGQTGDKTLTAYPVRPNSPADKH